MDETPNSGNWLSWEPPKCHFKGRGDNFYILQSQRWLHS